MGWVLRLVETETDGPSPGVDVMEMARRGALGDIANLGLTLPEAKQLLARVQQVVVAAQTHDHAVSRYHVATATNLVFAGAGLPFTIPIVDFSGEGGDVGAACYCRPAQEAI
jgi:hypothetical protein